MLETFHGLKIEAVACALPPTRRTAESFNEQFGEAVVSRFRQVVGVEAYHVAADGQRTSDLAEAAARDLIAANRLDPQQIDVLLFLTQTPDGDAPATATQLQGRLGLGEHILALDLNQGCAGFLAGLLTAAHFLHNPAIRKVLLLGGDTLTRRVDPTDHTAAMLFGDAGFAAVIGRDEAAPAWHIASATAASDAITLPHGKPFQMDGTAVFNFTITRVPEQIRHLLHATGTAPEQIDLLLLHQANAFIVRQIARMAHFPPEKVPCRIAQRGNTSSASIPLLLCDLAAEGHTGPQCVLLSAFGVGLTWISALLSLDFSTCLPPRIHPE